MGDNKSTGTVQNGHTKASFLKEVFRILLEDGVESGTDVNSKVIEFLHPDELTKKLDLTITKQGNDDECLLELCKDTIKYSVKTGHPRFFNQLYGGQSQHGLAGAWLTETLNTSQYTYEVAPVFTLMEQEVLKHMADILGCSDMDGIFCPGGSITNLYGLNLARYHRYPNVKTEGMRAIPNIVLFTSEQAHYSLNKATAVLGIGLNAIRMIPCDSSGRMDPVKLEQSVEEAESLGYVPFFVHATSGTTVLGAYDPLDAIADVCLRHNMWLHVDACWGGGALLSKKHRHLLKGIERSDSAAWNAHKMMGTPLQCCAFLTKHKGLLMKCHCANASYLFQQDKFYDVSYDTGDKSIQCGRKVDVFKLWLMWKAKGDIGFEETIDKIFDNARYLAEKISQNDDFKLVLNEPQCTNVCFWYIPQCLRGQDMDSDWWQRMAKVAPLIKKRMVMKGTLLVGYQPLGDWVNFFRMVMVNPECTTEDIDFILEEIHTLGKDIAV